MAVKFAQSNIPPQTNTSNKYVMKPAKVKAHVWTGDSNFAQPPVYNAPSPQYIVAYPQQQIQYVQHQTQYPQPISNQPVKISRFNKKKRIMMGISAALLVTCGLGLALTSQRGKYLLGNIGKRGVKNFLDTEQKSELRAAISYICKNLNLQPELDKMGVKNIRRIANATNNAGVLDLIFGNAFIIRQTETAGNKIENVKKIIDFNKKTGFGLFNEFIRAQECCLFNQKLSYNIIGAAQNGEKAIRIKPINIDSLPKNTIRTELSKLSNDVWAVNIAIPRENEPVADLLTAHVPVKLLKELDNGQMFSKFLSKFGGKKDEKLFLIFGNFRNMLK